MSALRIDSGMRTLISSVHFSKVGVECGILLFSMEVGMRGLAMGLLLVLAGCAHDPATLKTDGDVGLQMQTAKPIAEATACVARQAATAHPLISAQAHGSEVFVYWQGALWGIATLRPVGPQTQIELRVQPAMIVATRDSVYAAIRSC